MSAVRCGIDRSSTLGARQNQTGICSLGNGERPPPGWHSRSDCIGPRNTARCLTLNKQNIVEQVIGTLERELEAAMRSARAAHAGATDEQNKAENKYDTRGLEASYLAHGQSRQAAETMQAIQLYRALPLRAFAPGEAIDLGALVELDHKGERFFYFIGPRAGGTEIEADGVTVLVLTQQSPLGQELSGLREGESFHMATGRTRDTYRVVRVL